MMAMTTFSIQKFVFLCLYSGALFLLVIKHRNFIEFSVPSSPPESPKCDVLSSTSIYITWSPPPVDSQNGKVRGYKVFYIATDDIYEKEMHVVKSNNQYLTVENLKKYTNYSVWVLAYTKVGDGVKTKQLFCRTYEDGNMVFYIHVNSIFITGRN